MAPSSQPDTELVLRLVAQHVMPPCARSVSWAVVSHSLGVLWPLAGVTHGLRALVKGLVDGVPWPAERTRLLGAAPQSWAEQWACDSSYQGDLAVFRLVTWRIQERYGGRIPQRITNFALVSAAVSGHARLVRWLIRLGADPAHGCYRAANWALATVPADNDKAWNAETAHERALAVLCVLTELRRGSPGPPYIHLVHLEKSCTRSRILRMSNTTTKASNMAPNSMCRLISPGRTTCSPGAD